MPIKYNYAKDNDRYAQLYRLLELLRMDFNTNIINKDKHEVLESKVTQEILKYRFKIKNNATINTNTGDIT